MLRVTDECSFQPTGGERWSCICKSVCGINVNSLVHEYLLQNQAFRLVDFKNTKSITVSSRSYLLGSIQFIYIEAEKYGTPWILTQLK